MSQNMLNSKAHNLDRLTDSDPIVTDYVLKVPAKCLRCGTEILEKTLWNGTSARVTGNLATFREIGMNEVACGDGRYACALKDPSFSKRNSAATQIQLPPQHVSPRTSDQR